jgi:hypothetical protein
MRVNSWIGPALSFLLALLLSMLAGAPKFPVARLPQATSDFARLRESFRK